jgi:hypothetical protein
MEKIQEERHVFQPGWPGPLKGLPPIIMDGFRGIIRSESLGFLGKEPLGVLSVGWASRFGNRCPQPTLLPDCRGDLNPLAVQPALLVRPPPRQGLSDPPVASGFPPN